MKDSDWEERLRKRELRTIRRERRMEYEKQRRKWKAEEHGKEVSDMAVSREALHTDNKRKAKNDKRPGSDRFLRAYSFISVTPFDKRHAIPPGWRSRSFNERRQYAGFFRAFIYPYPVPESLLLTAQNRETTANERGTPVKSPYYEIIVLAKKWVNDITCGESFYKRNKSHFTRAEAHYFLNARTEYTGVPSLLRQLFFARCKARKMERKRCAVVSGVFADKFFKDFNHPLVIQFLDLIGRTEAYRFDLGGLGDICDFITAKIGEDRAAEAREKPFTLSGRTIFSVIALVNEWHEALQREQEVRDALNEARHERRRGNHTGNTEKQPDISRWTGMGIAPFTYQTDDGIWTVSELLTSQALLAEGRKMKNCVASYASRCATGATALFTVTRTYQALPTTESMATLEVRRPDRVLVQAKGKCNRAVSPGTMNIIRRWAQLNRIKTGLR
jgi:hypothetical protein